jgi:hypothetical protein
LTFLFRDDPPVSPWSIHEALLGSGGRAHSDDEVIGYMEQAGFINVRAVEFVHNVLTRVTGHKAEIRGQENSTPA